MREKIKKILIGYLPGFITGLIICGCVSVIAATYFPSNDVTYDNSNSGLQSTNVQGAIDELYGVCFPPLTGGEVILDQVDVVTSGDGLYKDEYEDRYFYKGANVNNYITFSGETWRILSIEADGRIKIIRNTIIGDIAWDTSGGTYGSNNWARPATLNTYLNEEYKNTLLDKDKIATSTWKIGGVVFGDTNLSSTITDEKNSTWSGDISLITVSEYIRTNINTSQCGSFNLNNTNYTTCKNTTWLYIINEDWWLLSPYFGTSNIVFNLYSNGTFHTDYANYTTYGRGVRPALYLKSDVKITGGDGSQSNPYTIE